MPLRFPPEEMIPVGTSRPVKHWYEGTEGPATAVCKGPRERREFKLRHARRSRRRLARDTTARVADELE
jgi:hypothetical protein